MKYNEYQQDLRRIYESEVYGIALFAMAKKMAFTARRKAQWESLKQLEEVTLACFEQFAEKQQITFDYPLLWRIKGHAEGIALGLLPWKMAMKLLRDGTLDFQTRFRRLKEHADKDTQAFFDYVYAHEKSIEAFAIAELAGRSGTLGAVERVIAKGEIMTTGC